jgi:hypothetical protein
MHGSHDHAQHRAPALPAGVSLLRLSAIARLSIALALSALIWLLVYFITR